MKSVAVLTAISVIATTTATAYGYEYSDYTWSSYGGKEYALTLDMGDWDQCETEAAAIGGHLVAINDINENDWLTVLIADARTREHPDPSNNLAWIGFRDIGGDNWGWISGEPVTFTNLYSGWPEGGTHAYLLGAEHFSAGEWSAHYVHHDLYEYNPYGIIEIPEPATLSLLVLGGLLVIRRPR